jgi:ABC-2 type transport system permease protein
MKNILILLKNNFIVSSGINKLLKNKTIKSALILLFIIYIITSLLVTFTGMANTLADNLETYNLLPFMIVVFFCLVSFVTFMFSLNIAKGSLFNGNDNDLLFSLPIKSSSILASRLIYTLVWNLLTSLFIIGPAIFVYVSRVNVDAMFYIFMFLVFILLPIIPTIIASFIGYFIAFLTSKSKSKNWFEIILSLVFIFAIYYLMYNGNTIITSLAGNQENLMTILKYGLYPVYLVNGIFSDNNYWMLIQYLIINISLLIIFVLILSNSYKKIISKLQENKTKSNYVMKELKTTSITKSLLNKEVKRYISSPMYVLNTIFGIIIILILSLSTIFYDISDIIEIIGMNASGVSIFELLILLVAFVSFMTSTTSAAISIEGKNFWIPKSLPIDNKKILDSKILLNLLLIIPVTFLSIIILKFTIGLTIIQMLVLLILTVLFSVCAVQFGLLMNLKFPKMDAQNDVTIVKRSLSVMISIIVPIIILSFISSTYPLLTKTINPNTIILIISVVILLISIIERVLLNSWGVKRINEIA